HPLSGVVPDAVVARLVTGALLTLASTDNVLLTEHEGVARPVGNRGADVRVPTEAGDRDQGQRWRIIVRLVDPVLAGLGPGRWRVGDVATDNCAVRPALVPGGPVTGAAGVVAGRPGQIARLTGRQTRPRAILVARAEQAGTRPRRAVEDLDGGLPSL